MSLILTGYNKSLKAVMSGAIDPEIQFVVMWEDYDKSGKYLGADMTLITSNDTTEVELVATPNVEAESKDTIRKIRYINVYNADDASVTVSIFIDDAATNWLLLKATIATLENLHYDEGAGWKSLNSTADLMVSA